jgi:subtilisin family serine protease
LNDSRLNWGVVKLDITTKLWMERQITGNSIRIGVLDAGDIPQHIDLPIFPKSQQDFSEALSSSIKRHGAWCAGVAAASGTEIFGVAPEAGIAYGKVALHSASVASAIEWLLEVRPAVHIISISLELFKENDAPQDFDLLQKAVDLAEDKGKIIVAAVGNDLSRRKEMPDRYPASFPTVLAIGALSQELNVYKESGMNKNIDLLAPGEKLLTAEQGGGVYNDFSRTSAATAFAAGAIALLLQFLKDNHIEMTPAEIRNLLKDTATFNFPDASKCSSNLHGCGIINPLAAIERASLHA